MSDIGSGDTFAAAAGRLAGMMGAAFGWRPHEFWGATPDEVAAILTAWRPPEAAPPDRHAIARLQEAFPDG